MRSSEPQLQHDINNIRKTYADYPHLAQLSSRPLDLAETEKLKAYAARYQELYPQAKVNLNDPNTNYQLMTVPRTICDYPGDTAEITRFSMYYGYTAWGGREEVVRDYPFAVNLFCPEKSMGQEWDDELWNRLKKGPYLALDSNKVIHPG